MAFNLYKTYNKVKHKFKKPKLYWKFGLWKHDHCLPVWRRGPQIRLGRYREHWYQPQNTIHYKSGVSYWTNSRGEKCEIPCYSMSTHKLPCYYAWNRPVRKKLKKLGLAWIPPVIQLPLWCSYYVFNRDVMWKTKFENYRFEFPPQFTIVFFGLALSFWLKPPFMDNICDEDDYWESILWYLNECNLDEDYKHINNKWFK